MDMVSPSATPVSPAGTHHDDGSLTRNDTGVAEGDTISIYYDPMIAKLCSWSSDRSAAIARMRVALDDFVMRGIGHNIPFLSAVMEHDRFLGGDISTAFIDEEYQDGFQGVTPSPDRMRDLGLIIAAAAHKDAQRQSSPLCQDWAIQFVTDDPAKMADANLRCSFHPHQQDAALTADINPYADTAASATDVICIEIYQSDDTPRVAASITDQKDNKTRHYICQLHKDKDCWQIYYRGTHLAAHARPPHIAALAHYMKPVVTPDRSNMLLCPMPGNLVTIMVANGDVVEAGQTLCIVEAMKMENALVAEKRCRIDSIDAKAGDILSVDAVIMRFADVGT